MNDRTNNQFRLSPEQLQQLQNFNNNIGVDWLQNLLSIAQAAPQQPNLAPNRPNVPAAPNRPGLISDQANLNSSRPSVNSNRSSLVPGQANILPGQANLISGQTNLVTGQASLIQPEQPQNLSKRRGRRPKQFTNNVPPSSADAGPQANNFGLGNAGIEGQRIQQILRQQQQRQQQQLMHQEITQRLHQQLQQIVQQSSNRTQSLASDPMPSMASIQTPPMPADQQQKRKRGRPPLPSTSAGSSAANYNYLNMVAAVRNQHDRDRMQRESRMQQERDRQREHRLAQERAEHQREIILQQERERERQRLEIERQRKAQHRLAVADIERERRRQHMIMVRNLDAYKRNEEREKTMNAMMAERTKQLERRMYQKRLEVELIKDIRKPVDDMMLRNQKPLATLNRIPGLKLPGKAFADLLMSYEFLFNFGETVGLELKEIPDINTLQLGLLNLNTWAEDQFISILHHLCMFAVKDPRFPYTGSTKEIENLERTNEGLSQLLHFYLQVLTLNSKTDMEHEYRLYKLIENKYFLSLNATQKAEMLAFICNELLCSQTVTRQMEDTIENVAKLRKDKWVLENELRKYRIVKSKRELKEESQKAREAAAAVNNTNGEAERADEDKLNGNSKTDIKEEEEKTNKPNLTNGSSVCETTPNKRENETDTSLQPNNTADLDDLEPGMTNDELNKKIENLTRQYNKTSNKLERAINSMRASPLGQDRFRRRYWVLPQVGGVFVEGMESSEPDELENNKFTEEELEEYEKEQQALNELASNTESTEGEPERMETDIKNEKDEEDMEVKEEVADVKDEAEAMDIKEDEGDESEIKEEPKIESLENGESEGDKNIAEVSNEEINNSQVPNIPWFSILPRNICDFSNNATDIPEVVDGGEEGEVEGDKKVKEEENTEIKAELTSEELRAMKHDICPALAKKLEELEAEQYETPRKIHPQFQCGWWRITDAQQLKAILSVLHERGSRERVLHKHLTKHFQYACNSCKNTTVDFEITSYDRQLAGKNYGAPMPHTDDDSADDLKDGDEEEEEEEEGVEEIDEETGDDRATQQAAIAPSRKSKRKKAISGSTRSRRLRARAAARKKVENSKNKLA